MKRGRCHKDVVRSVAGAELSWALLSGSIAAPLQRWRWLRNPRFLRPQEDTPMKLVTLVLFASMAVAGVAGAATVGYTDLPTYLGAGGNPTIQLTFDPKVVTTIVSGASFS